MHAPPLELEVSLEDVLDEWDRLRDESSSEAAEAFLGKLNPGLRDRARAEIGKLAKVGNALSSLNQPVADEQDRDESVGIGVAGRFVELEYHAGGGMGVVYKAWDAELHRVVAYKVMRPRYLNDETARDRFRLEAEATSRLRHQGIVPVHALVLDDSGLPAYAMEFVEGRTLGKVIAEFHATSFDESENSRARMLKDLLRRLIAACHVLSYAHRQGYVHGDIKPENILIDDFGGTRVLDWGIARRLGDEESPASEIARPRLVTPGFHGESAAQLGKPATPASDVHSLGVTLRSILFNSTSVSTDRGKPSRTRFTPPPALVAISEKATAGNPADRFSSPATLGLEIEHWLSDEAVSVYRDSTLIQVLRWARRHRAWARAGTVSLVLLFAILSVSLVFINNERKLRDRALVAAAAANREAERQGGLSERNLYAAEMILAAQAWKSGRIDAVHSRLERTRPGREILTDRRGFEWRLLDKLTRSELRSLAGHERSVNDVDFLVDGSRVATASGDGTIRIWDVATGRLTSVLAVSNSPVRAAEFSPDGAKVAAGTGDGKVSVWDVKSGAKTLGISAGTGAVNDLDFSADGRMLAGAGEDRCVRIWNAETGELIRAFRKHTQGVQCVAFASDGRRIASADGDRSRNEAILWNPETGEILKYLKGHHDVIRSIAFDPAGARIVTGAEDYLLKLWDAESGRETASFRGHDGFVQGVEFDPSGVWIVSASRDQTVRIWSVAQARELLVIRGHERGVNKAKFSPDGRLVASAGGDRVAKLWDRAGNLEYHRRNQLESMSGSETKILDGHSDEVYSVSYDSTGTRLATTGKDGSVRVWDPRSRREIWIGRDKHAAGQSAAFARDDAIVASAHLDGVVRIWDAVTGRLLHLLQDARVPAYCLAFGARNQIAVGYGDGFVRIWDSTKIGEFSKYQAHFGEVRGVAFGPDGESIATVGGDGRLRIRGSDPAADRVAVLSTADLRCVAFSKRGDSIAAAGIDRTIRTIRINKDQELFNLEVIGEHSTYVYAVEFSPDGRRLFSAGHDRAVRVWDLESRQELLSLPGVDHYVSGLAVRPDGNAVAAGLWDWTARIWDVGPDADSRADGREIFNYVNYYINKGYDISKINKKLLEDKTANPKPLGLALDRVDGARAAVEAAERRRPGRPAQPAAADQPLPDRSVLMKPSSTKRQYLEARAKAEKTLRSRRDAETLTTLGMARYRLEEFREALDAFEEADRLRAQEPSRTRLTFDAFRAMTMFRLDKPDDARKLLKEVALAGKTRPNLPTDTRELIREAERLIDK